MKNVLLVDDDNIFNFLTTKTMERMDFINDVHTALNGKEALNLFNSYYAGSRSLPDVILLDLKMPIMDGFGFLQAFRMLNLKGKEKVKVVVVSSSKTPTDIARAKSLGATEYLTKPIDENSLRDALAPV